MLRADRDGPACARARRSATSDARETGGAGTIRSRPGRDRGPRGLQHRLLAVPALAVDQRLVLGAGGGAARAGDAHRERLRGGGSRQNRGGVARDRPFRDVSRPLRARGRPARRHLQVLQQAVWPVSLAHDGPPAALRGLVPRDRRVDRSRPDAAAADHRGARGGPAAVAAQGRTRGRRRRPARPRPQLGRDRGARRAWRRGRPRVRARRRLGRRGQAHRGQVVAQLRPRSSLRRRPLFSHDGPGSGAVLRRRAALRDPRARRGAAREGVAAGRS